MIDKTQRLYESLDSFLTEYKEKNEGNKYRPVAVGRYGIRTRESIYSKELAKDYSKNKLIFKNTLTVGMGSTQIDIGVLSEDATYAVSPAYHTYRIHDINSDYLRYCLECRNQDMFVRYVKRGSRQGKSIDLKRWITYRIPVYPESVQAEIVKRLDSVKAILSLREQELNALDDLIKARFIELFGDPMTDVSKWSASTIGEQFNVSSGGTPATGEKAYWENGTIPWIGSNMCQDTMLSENDGKFITEEGYAHSSAKWFHKGTVLVALVGATIGKTALLRFDTTTNQNIAAIDVTQNAAFSSEFVFYHMQMLYSKFMEIGSGKFKMANQSFIRQLPLICPPIELQEQFAAFVEQTDKSKATVQKALDETQLLFDSLMQQYFG